MNSISSDAGGAANRPCQSAPDEAFFGAAASPSAVAPPFFFDVDFAADFGRVGGVDSGTGIAIYRVRKDNGARLQTGELAHAFGECHAADSLVGDHQNRVVTGNGTDHVFEASAIKGTRHHMR